MIVVRLFTSLSKVRHVALPKDTVSPEGQIEILRLADSSNPIDKLKHGSYGINRLLSP